MRLIVISLFLDYILSKEIASTRIVGGYEVNPPFKYNFITSIQDKGKHFCGGTLIKPNIILSAAHCNEVINATSKLEVVLHRHAMNLSDQQEHGVRSKIIQIKVHPNYIVKGHHDDIMIFKLKFSLSIKPSIIVDTSKIPLEKFTMAYVIGWGTTKAGSISNSNKLLETRVPMVPINKCKELYEKEGLDVDLGQNVCFGYSKGGKDSCQGDSGGPLFITRDNQTILVGIVSYGIGCAFPNFPGVYTRVSAFNDFINKCN